MKLINKIWPLMILTSVGYGMKDAEAGGVSEPDSLDVTPTEQRINDLDGFLTWYEINAKDLSVGRTYPNPMWLRAQIDELRNRSSLDDPDCWRLVDKLEGDLALERELAEGSENWIASLENFLEKQGVDELWKLYLDDPGFELPKPVEALQDTIVAPPKKDYDKKEECGFWPGFSAGNNTFGGGIDFHCDYGILGIQYLRGFGNSETNLEKVIVAQQDAPFGSQEISKTIETGVENRNYILGKVGAFVTDNLAFYGLGGIEFHREGTLSTDVATHYDHEGNIIGQDIDPAVYDRDNKAGIALGVGGEYQFSEDFSLSGSVLTDLDNDPFYNVTVKWRFENE